MMFSSSSPPPIPWIRCLAAILLVWSSCLLGGCSQEELKQAYDSAKQTTTSISADLAEKSSQVAEATTTAIEAKLPEDGSIEFRSDSPIPKASSASIEVIAIGDGRPSSIQLCSYDPDAAQLTYPAFHLHGPTPVTDVASLAGTTVQCDTYLQTSRSEPVAMTRPGEAMTVTFGDYNAEEKSISASITPVQMIRSDDEIVSINGGTIVAVVREVQQ